MQRTKAGVFRPEDYKEFNSYAIDKITQFLNRRGFYVPAKKEDYTIDIHAWKNNKLYRIEAEVRSDLNFTTRETFPFNTVSFLARKKKYNLVSSFWYFLVCKQTEYCVFCNSDTIFKEQYKQVLNVNNIKRFGRDEFYRVPRGLCQFRNLNE